MRLTLYTDFALRVLIQVGLNGAKLTTINDIARSFGISKPHLMKVVNDLGQKGYLDTVRGRNGGIRLMREPRHINRPSGARHGGNARCYWLPWARGLLPHSACLRTPRRSARCNRSVSVGSGYLHFGRFDQAAKSVVIAPVAPSGFVAVELEGRKSDEFEFEKSAGT
jgi:Iron-dependent Transcriptional regulator